MKLENNLVVFENLITANPAVIGDAQNIMAKTSSYQSDAHIGEMAELLKIEQMGRQAVSNFNKNFGV